MRKRKTKSIDYQDIYLFTPQKTYGYRYNFKKTRYITMFAFIQYGIGPQFYSSKIESLSQPHSNAPFWGLFHLAGFLFFLLIALDLWETDIPLSSREAFSSLFLGRSPFFLSTCRDSPGTEAVSFSSLSQTHSTASSRGLFHLKRFIGLVGF